MTKSISSSSTSTQTFLLVVLLIIVGFIFIAKSSMTTKPKSGTSSATEAIVGTSDLDQAQDQLNTVNIDGVDNGLNELNLEVSGF